MNRSGNSWVPGFLLSLFIFLAAPAADAREQSKERDESLWRVTHSVNVAVDSLPSNCVLVALAAYHSLPEKPTVTWKKVISIRCGALRPGSTNVLVPEDSTHVYLVFRALGRFYAYDRRGCLTICPKSRNAAAVATAIEEASDRKEVFAAGYLDQ